MTIIRDNKQHGLSPEFRLVQRPNLSRAGSILAPLTIGDDTIMAPLDSGSFPRSTVTRRAAIRAVITEEYIRAMSVDTKTRTGRKAMRTLAYRTAKSIHYRKYYNTVKAERAGRLARRRMSTLLAKEAADLRQVERYAHDNRIGARRDTSDPRQKLFTLTASEFKAQTYTVPNCFNSSLPAYVRNCKPIQTPVVPYTVDRYGRAIDTQPGLVDSWRD